MGITKLLVTSALGLVLVCVAAAPAAAHRPYNDDDSGYLKVSSAVIRPVGQLLEWVVFRPFHAISTVLGGQDRDELDADLRCSSLRPRRGCERR